MPRILSILVVLLAALAGPALASGDFGCTPAWTLVHTARTDCDNQPFLSPGNDSRVNLQLLLLDAGQARLHPPAPPDDSSTDATASVWTSASPFTLEDFTGLLTPVEAAASAEGSSDRADGEGSRCNSNGAGLDQFKAALDQARGLPGDEKSALADARAALRPGCDDAAKPAEPAPSVPVKSTPGRQFAAYLAGAAAFYAGDWDAAHASFAALRSSSQPWLRQTARYMLGRVEVNRAQASAFDQYGVLDLTKVDAKAAAAAETDFQAYLHDYPSGDYAASAKGLLRRTAWLGGQPQRLAVQFSGQFAASEAARNVSEVELVQEADAKLLANADAASIKEPLLLASWDLMQMRRSDEAGGQKPIAIAALEAQKPVFAGHQSLFEYLLAAYALFDDRDPAKALALLPAVAPSASMTYLEYSRQVVRGLALEATKDAAGARAHWEQLMPAVRQPLQRPPIELALAMNAERAGRLADVFAVGSPIRDADVREILLRNAAGPALLRQRSRAAEASERERRAALSTLLYKELTRGRYQAFAEDLALLPPAPAEATPGYPDPDADLRPFRWDGTQDDEPYACAPLRETARALARDPKDAHDQLCVGEWVRLKDRDDDPLDKPPPAGELGGAPSQFPGGGYSRLEVYKQVLTNPEASPNDKAYALYRAVSCYAPSGYNHCSGPGVEPAQRKAWFKTLKADYAKSVWAQRLKYYW
jgi:hypothetical protein